MRRAQLTLVGLLLLLFAAQGAQAQERERRDEDDDRTERREDRSRRDRDADRDTDRERRRRRDRGNEEDREERDRSERDKRGERSKRGRGKRGRGPKFCRTGEGHPVHGREWCIEQGFGLGDARYDDRYDDDRYGDGRYGDYDRRRWRRVEARDIALDVGLLDRFRDGLDEDALRRTLGRDAFFRLREHQRRLRRRGRLEGRLEGGGGILSGDRGGERVLRVRADGHALARFVDRDGDERVEVVLLRRRR